MRNRQIANVKFRRQFPLCGYILDFYCAECKLGIEADGGQHYEEKNRRRDELRTKALSQKGVKVLRFNDNEILNNTEGICEEIYRVLTSSPSPSPHGGEGFNE